MATAQPIEPWHAETYPTLKDRPDPDKVGLLAPDVRAWVSKNYKNFMSVENITLVGNPACFQ